MACEERPRARCNTGITVGLECPGTCPSRGVGTDAYTLSIEIFAENAYSQLGIGAGGSVGGNGQGGPESI
jgi:hypothetical protein